METRAITSQSVSVGDWKFYDKLQTSLRNKDHGVLSSLLLIHSLLTQEKIERFTAWLSQTFPYEILPACHAIAVHNLDFADSKFSLRKHPYAFLLILSDILQDWKRCANRQDFSELRKIVFDCTKTPPALEISLKIHAEEKKDELKRLESRLNTDHLMTVRIRQENGGFEFDF